MQNKSFPLALVIFGVTALATISIFQKFLHLSIGHTVYYCQNIIRSLSFQVPQPIGILLIGVFILMITLPFARFLFTWQKTARHKRKLIPSKKLDLKIKNLIRKYNLNTQNVVQVTNRKIFAYCLGFIHPKIYISSGLISKMSAKELEAILLHEMNHLKNNDPLVLTTVTLIHSLFPYLPILSDLIKNLRIDREIQADRFVVQTLGESGSLLSVMKKLLSLPKQEHLAFSMGISDIDTLELRIRALLGKTEVKQKKLPLINTVISLIIFSTISLIALAPVHAIENHEDGKDVMTVWCERNQSVNPTQRVENSSHPFSTK